MLLRCPSIISHMSHAVYRVRYVCVRDHRLLPGYCLQLYRVPNRGKSQSTNALRIGSSLTGPRIWRSPYISGVKLAGIDGEMKLFYRLRWWLLHIIKQSLSAAQLAPLLGLCIDSCWEGVYRFSPPPLQSLFVGPRKHHPRMGLNELSWGVKATVCESLTLANRHARPQLQQHHVADGARRVLKAKIHQESAPPKSCTTYMKNYSLSRYSTHATLGEKGCRRPMMDNRTRVAHEKRVLRMCLFVNNGGVEGLERVSLPLSEQSCGH